MNCVNWKTGYFQIITGRRVLPEPEGTNKHNDLKQLGFSEGTEIGRVLNYLLDR